MKKLNILFMLFLLVVVVACEEDYESPNPFSDVSWYTSQLNAGGYSLKKDDFMAFRDLSQGALSHEWSIEEGNYFLSDGFSKGDSLAHFIDKETGLKSEENTVNILFGKSGLNSVRLRNTFSEKVSFNGESLNEAKKIDDVWVFDTTFVVDVFADMEPAFKVFQLIEDDEGNVIEEKEVLSILEEDMPDKEESASWLNIQVEVGGRLKFVDMTTIDRPTGRTWTIYNQGSPITSKDSSTIVFYNKLGFITDFSGSFKSERTSENGSIPASTVSKLIPLKIEVVPSTKPFIFAGNLKEMEDETILFNVSGEVKAFSGMEGAFTVHVTNDNGFDEDIAVSQAKVNSSDASIIELKLSAPIYGTDIITVSYNNAIGSIKSVDARELNSFASELVVNFSAAVNILNEDYSGFEIVDGSINNAYANRYYIGAQNKDGVFQRVEENAASGIACMRYKGAVESERKLYGMGIADTKTIPAGTYIISHKVYIEEGSTIKAFVTDVSNKADSWAAFWTGTWNLESLPRGEWVTVEKTVVFSKDIISRAPATSGAKSRYSFYVRATDNADVSGEQTFYLDDMTMVPLDVRP